jgi:membrane-bound hydrogenase subunit beta
MWGEHGAFLRGEAVRLSGVACSPEDVLEGLRAFLGERLRAGVLRRSEGAGGATPTIWCALGPEHLPDLVEALAAFDFPHFHVLSGDDLGDRIRLIYHFSLFLAVPDGRVGLACAVDLPKECPIVPSLCERIPGVEYSEREMREMLGVRFAGAEWSGRIFLPEEWDESVHPWRRDETAPGPDRFLRLE